MQFSLLPAVLIAIPLVLSMGASRLYSGHHLLIVSRACLVATEVLFVLCVCFSIMDYTKGREMM